jgi:GT2 family glycosyltransferase
MITASVVAFRTPGPELSNCLELLRRSCVSRVWVIDNSRCEYIREIVGRFEGFCYIAGDNRGYGSGHNVALRGAAAEGADYHLVLNTDVDFEPESIARLCDYMDSHSDVGMAQPRIVDGNGRMLHSCRMLPTPSDLIVRRFTPVWFMTGRRSEYLLEHLDPDTEHNIPYHQGSFMMLRMEAVKQCGGFDERFFLYPEDIDLTRRIHRSWRTMYVPQPTVVHTHRAASYHSIRMLWVHIVNICRYFNKWGWLRDDERSRFNAPLRAKVKKSGARE